MHCSVIPSKKTPEQSEEIGVDQGHVGGGEEGEGEVPHDLLHLLLLVVPVRKASTYCMEGRIEPSRIEEDVDQR